MFAIFFAIFGLQRCLLYSPEVSIALASSDGTRTGLGAAVHNLQSDAAAMKLMVQRTGIRAYRASYNANH